MDNILTLKEVAERLKVSECWLYRKAKANILPHIRIGGVIRVREKDLENWIMGHSIGGKLKV